MLAEIKELQNGAVNQLIEAIKTQNKSSYTFRAPTGSGKTYMMADFMNRMLEQNQKIIFLVSSLFDEKAFPFLPLRLKGTRTLF